MEKLIGILGKKNKSKDDDKIEIKNDDKNQSNNYSNFYQFRDGNNELKLNNLLNLFIGIGIALGKKFNLLISFYLFISSFLGFISFYFISLTLLILLIR